MSKNYNKSYKSKINAKDTKRIQWKNNERKVIDINIRNLMLKVMIEMNLCYYMIAFWLMKNKVFCLIKGPNCCVRF
jgi:hypothetical protein